MTRNYTLLLLLFLGIIPASARQRTRQEIKGIAQKLIATSNDSRRSKVAVKGHDDFQDELKEVAATANYTVMAYDKGGFAIIANDDANDAVIAIRRHRAFPLPIRHWHGISLSSTRCTRTSSTTLNIMATGMISTTT